jgi:serine/threonine protein kinase, bacterial
LPVSAGLTAYGEQVDTRIPPRRRWWRRKVILISGALLTVAVSAAAIFITSPQRDNSNGPQSLPATSTQHREPAYGSQVTLPFTDLDQPSAVAVDAAGNLYVTDGGHNGVQGGRPNRVVELAAGSSTQSVPPFTGLDEPPAWRWTAPATSTSWTRIGC